MKINCVVVTYNRVDLLKDNIKSILNQTYKINKIIIINNNSTDSTNEFLKLYTDNPLFEIYNLKENIGGAGGFSYGIRKAYEACCDWVWLMDDDTIPNNDALEKLVIASQVDDKIGFVCSKVLWTNGDIHKMNIPSFSYDKDFPLHFYTNKVDAMVINAASFVSLLVKSSVIKHVGLPIKEFFIWTDDFEFTQRMFKNGFIGLYADKSIVIHKTPYNYVSDIITAPKETRWKFFYGVRNELFIRKRKKNKLALFFSLINFYRKQVIQINKRKDGKKEFRITVLKAVIAAYSFRPKIEYLQ